MERRLITVRGIVQGVGFRPFVYALASRLQLNGFVKNETGRLEIEIEGESDVLDRFLADLESSPPRLSRIEAVSWQTRPVRGEKTFSIRESAADRDGSVFISPDVARSTIPTFATTPIAG